MIGGAPRCALLGGFAIGAPSFVAIANTRLMRNVSEDACTRCMGGVVSVVTELTDDAFLLSTIQLYFPSQVTRQ